MARKSCIKTFLKWTNGLRAQLINKTQTVLSFLSTIKFNVLHQCFHFIYLSENCWTKHTYTQKKHKFWSELKMQKYLNFSPNIREIVEAFSRQMKKLAVLLLGAVGFSLGLQQLKNERASSADIGSSGEKVAAD